MFVFIQQKGPDGRPIARLLTESGPLQGKIFRLKTERVRVGSAVDNDVVVPLPDVEAYHTELDLSQFPAQIRTIDGNADLWVDGEYTHHTTLQHGSKIQLNPPSQVTGAHESIVLTEEPMAPRFDDVKTVLGAPGLKWASVQSRPPVLPDSPKLKAPSAPAAFQQKKLEVLLAVGQALSRPEELTQKIDRVLELLFDTMDIDRAAVLVLADDAAEKFGHERFAWSSYRDKHGPTEAMQLSSTIINRVLEEEVAVLTQDAQSEGWLDSARSVLGQEIRICVCTPLKTSNGVLGVLYADGTRASQSFSREDLGFFTAFSNQAAIAIENARLLQVALEKERIEQDLRVARRIQRWLYPKEAPQLEGYELFGDSQAMDEVGGDYFDYMLLEPHLLALVVGDVSGHGISSALVMTMTRSILRGSLVSGWTPGQILQRVNQLVSEDMLPRMFVTMVLVIVDLRTGQFAYASAGHTPMYQFNAASQQVSELPVPKAGPLGMSRWARLKPTYQDSYHTLASGDVLMLYTDGILEATNAQEEQLGEARLQSFFRESCEQRSASDVHGRLFEHVAGFCAGREIGDDSTTIILKRVS